jgi:hypothetical protein
MSSTLGDRADTRPVTEQLRLYRNRSDDPDDTGA